jgi:ubiquinone/menaquinone biosynthesis C-methylase UbiE
LPFRIAQIYQSTKARIISILKKYGEQLSKIEKKIGLIDERLTKYYPIFSKYAKRNEVVLDAGSGAGNFSLACAKTSEVISLEFSRSLLLKQKKSEKINRIRADVENLPFKSKSINLVLAISLLEHVSNSSIALTEFQRVLKPNAYLVIQLPNPQYFIEVHTLLPLVFLFPKKIRELLIRKRGYYTNLDFTNKILLKKAAPLFEITFYKALYYKIKTYPWPPGWIYVMRKRASALNA